MYSSDTIAAIATAPGQAALAIVRISGPQSIQIVDSCFEGKELNKQGTQTLHVGNFVAGLDGEVIDQVVISLFRSPGSATGEHVVEISCHGGDLIAQLILQELINQGCRMAEAGEFTKRSFLNGKIDLAQAEAIAELIHSKSTRAHELSLAHLEGRYSERIKQIAAQLLETVALVELELDFSEEDVEFADRPRLRSLLEESQSTLVDLLGSYRLGSVIRGGVDVAIVGRPNAGKSTLLNALLGYDRAIVSDIAGTTRDEIVSELEIDGILFRFHDTAGMRETEDEIEAAGVERSRAAVEKAEIVLYVFDSSLGLQEEEESFLTSITGGKAIFRLANKMDLASNSVVITDGLKISATEALDNSDHLEKLRRSIIEAAGASTGDADHSKIVSNFRHRELLTLAQESVERALESLKKESGERLSKDIRDAQYHLASITGETTNEDILGAIFSRFCIGK